MPGRGYAVVVSRHLLIAAIFLLAGTVMNVAVAWGCHLAVRGPQRYSVEYQLSDASTTAWWNENKPEGFTDEPAGIFSVERFGWSRVTFVGDEGGLFRIWTSGQVSISGQMQDIHQALYFTAGLPMRSLHGQGWSRKETTIQQSGIITTGSQDWLPFVPMWPGFAVNTVLYAVILWLLSGGPFSLRRWNRIRRELCPKCAYPVGESDVCSECGKALPDRAKAST